MDRMMKNTLNVRRTLSSQQSTMVVQTQSTSDDKKVIQQILAAHSPDANFDVNEQVLLNMAQDILNKANPKFPPLDPKTDPNVSEEGISEELALTIHKIGRELSCNCSSGGDMKLITAAVFDKLKKYSWEDKLVIALLAFAINYGEFRLPSLHETDPLAKYLVQFKSLPGISGQETLISDLLNVVIIAMAKSIIKLNELHSKNPQYISQGKYPFSQADISTDVYWAIQGIVACSSQSTSLMNTGKQYWRMIIEACMKLIQILENRHQKLTVICGQCSKVIVDKRDDIAYHELKEFMERTDIIDNKEVLIRLIHTNDDKPLFHGDTNEKVSLNVLLQSKMVILFFSYFDISDEEIKEIKQQIWKTDQRPYEIVWLPVLYRQEISNETKKVIDQKAMLMPWYSLHNSLTLHPCVIKYIKKHWKFEKKPLLVAFNEGGNANDSCNVYDMIMTWGTKAYPFNAQTEEKLWTTLKWGIEIFIDQKPENKGKLIYFYGGDDLDWIKNFISSMKEVVKGDGIKLIYVGKRHRESINNESLSESWDD